MNLSRRIEKALASDYLPRHLMIAGLHAYEGHENNPEQEFPALIVYAEDAQQHPEMPTSTGVRVVRVRCKFVVDSSDQDRGCIDAWKEQLENAMIDCPHLVELNAPTSGVDRRKVSGIHVYDAMHGGEPSDVHETEWVEDCLFDVVCQKL